MTSPELQRLMDHAAICDLIGASSEYMQRRELDALLDLWVPTGLMDMGGGAVHRGRAELRALMEDRWRLYTTSSLHFSGTRLLSYDGQRASVTSAVYACHVARDQDLQMMTWGRYDDEVELVDGQWRFVERHLLVAAIKHTDGEAGVPERFTNVARDAT